MKKILPAALLLFSAAVGSVSAQDKAPLREPRVRFGIGYRYSLCLIEQIKAKTPLVEDRAWGSPEFRRGGTLHLEGTVRITPQWNVGAGVGFGSYDDEIFKTCMAYAKAERLYGRRRSHWFNYAELGATFYPDNGTGGTASLGGGFRLALTRRTRMDFTAGLEWMNLVGEASVADSQGEWHTHKRGARMNRIGLTCGIAMHF